MNQSIDCVLESLLETLASSGYTPRSVQAIAYDLHPLIAMHKDQGFDHFSEEIASNFLAKVDNRFSNGAIKRTRYMHLYKVVGYFQQYAVNGKINMIARKRPTELIPYYESILCKIKAFPEWNEKTKHSIYQISHTYMKWLQTNGHSTFQSVDSSVIRAYLMDCSKRLKLNSVDAIRRGLKKFHWFLSKIEITHDAFQDVLSFITPTEHRIKAPASLEEVAEILSFIDRNSSIGKRDYAIILLAVVTGMRAIDIAGLTFDEIDWINGELKIIQAKTNNLVALPLTTDVGEALQDYILNGRPNSSDSHVFLRGHSPAVKIGASVPYQVYNGYRVKLGLPKAPFHALRRAVGSNLVIAGVPVTTVAQMLGHSSIEPTKQYISLDSINLQKCALSLGDLTLNAVGGAR